MSEWQRVVAWMSAIVGGIVLVGLGVFFAVIGLDRADKLASVIGALVGLIGIGLSTYGVVLARRAATSLSGGQKVLGSRVGGGLTQVRKARGNVRIGQDQSAASASSNPRSTGTSFNNTADSQAVVDSITKGPVRQIDDVDGDVDIDR